MHSHKCFHWLRFLPLVRASRRRLSSQLCGCCGQRRLDCQWFTTWWRWSTLRDVVSTQTLLLVWALVGFCFWMRDWGCIWIGSWACPEGFGVLSWLLDLALSFSGSGLIPSLLMMWPKYFTCSIPNVHFSRLNLTPFSLTRLRTARSLLSCSSWLYPHTRMSSMRIRMPSNLLNISSIWRWNPSCADTKPNGYLIHLYLPKTVLNVV